MINEEIARKTLNMEVRAAKVTGKLILNLLKKLMKEAEKLGGLEKLVNANGNEVKLKDMVKKGQLEEIPVEEAELKELKKELNRYGVKFSVMKDKESGKYSVFFQAKDMKVMDKAFKHALSESEKKTERKESIHKNIEKFKIAVIDTIFAPKKVTRQDVENFRFIPGTGNKAQFIMEAGIITTESKVVIPVVECRAPYNAFLDKVA